MPSLVQYGADASVELEFPDGALLAECGLPETAPLGDPVAAAAEALAALENYPPLSRWTTPADRVVLPLAEATPRGGQITAGVIGALVGAGVQPDGISVVRTQAEAADPRSDPRKWLAADCAEQIGLVTHDPDFRDGLAYLAATEGGEPILLNRAITDADIAIPIGGYTPTPTAGYFGPNTPIYPTFSGQRTLRRFRSPTTLNAQAIPKKGPAKVVDEVGWLLGVTLAVQAIPGPDDDLLAVVAGEVGAVGRRASLLYDRAWRGAVPHRASLAIAAVRGGAHRQTWANVARAVMAASCVVEEGGAIVVLSELATEPGLGVKRLADRAGRDRAIEWIRKERPDDALPATVLARVLDRARVYLLSRLDDSVVENLEIAPFSDAVELARLVASHGSCVLLANAPFAMPRVEEDV